MAYNIGGMLAQAGTNVGRLMGGGIADVGAGVGGLLTRRRERQAEQNAQEQFQQILGAYQTNPAGMMREAQQALMSPDENMRRMGKLLMDEAKRLTEARTAQTTALETAGQDIQREAQRKRAMQVAMQDGNERALVALRAGALDPVEYLSSRATEKPTQFDYTEKTVMRDGEPVVVQFGTSKTDPNVTIERVLGPAEPKEGKTGRKTLAQQLEEAGVESVDLTTLKGAQQARRDLIKLGESSLANSVGNIIEDLTPMSVKEGLDLVRSTNPEFVEAENLRELTSRFSALEGLTDQDIAGLSALIERTLTATTENDIKAVAELERFRKAKDLPQRIKDFALEIATGRLSEETIKEYSTLASAFEELAELRMSRALDSLIVYGSPKESDAAQRAKNMILGESQARIIP